MIFLSILLLIFIPGIVLTGAVWQDRLPMVGFFGISGALGTAWSVLLTYILASLHIPLSFITLGITSVIPAVLLISYAPTRLRLVNSAKRLPIFSWKSTGLYVLVAIVLIQPFLFIHKQLPTGDVQKAIYWANSILNTGKLPDYKESLALNRDPSDFSTPALHTITASVIKLSGDQYAGPAWLSFILAMTLAGLSVTIASLFTGSNTIQLLVFLFASLNTRFLRYILAPGYHYQNLIGELLLILALTLFLLLIKNRRTKKGETIPLFISCLFVLALLPLVHQFTAFLAIFAGVAMMVVTLLFYRSSIGNIFTFHKKGFSVVVFSVLILAVLVIFFSPLSRKLSALFNLHPHLKPFAILITDYPSFFGRTLLFVGLAGLMLFFTKQNKQSDRLPIALLVTYTAVFLILGQGNFFFIDIPSARTLFFASLPLSVLAGMFVGNIAKAKSFFAVTAVAIVLALQANSASQQVMAVSHAPRVNASVTGDTIDMIDFINSFEEKDGFNNLLIDDWNRRRLTWGILSNFNMVTRIGGDLRTIADEAKQSPLRQSLYEKNLDYEKIFMLGNSPVIEGLLRKHKIGLIASAEQATSNNFKYNSLLGKAYSDSDTTIFSFNPTEKMIQTEKEADFLLNPQTIANDVGDDEDIAPYAPISILATRVSDPIFRDDHTYREIQSADGIIRLNVGIYILPYWDREGKFVIQKPVRLLMRIRNNGVRARMLFDNKEITNFETSQNKDFKDIVIDVPKNTLRYNNKGFIDLKLDIQNGPLVIDLIAAGISK